MLSSPCKTCARHLCALNRKKFELVFIQVASSRPTMQTAHRATRLWRHWSGYICTRGMSSRNVMTVRVNVRRSHRASACCAAWPADSSRQVIKSDYCIRSAAPTDVARLAALENSCKKFSAGWDEGQIQDELAKEHAKVFVAASLQADEALGYIVGWLIAGELQVLELAVDPSHQSKGIGTALLGVLLRQCGCDEGVEAVLEVKECNKNAIDLYERHGFVRVGLRRDYYGDGSAAVLMARSP